MHMKETRSKTMDWNSLDHYKVQCQDVGNAGVNLPLIVGSFLITSVSLRFPVLICE